ncbi:MAG: 4Fe-4S ferredoxin iron-sulfur binding domain protein [Anaerocolumna sp.]|jgi:NAD-dependent dihydropyrimidine dehydrogenase PreA subunit/flavodoxin|nr:4Fe-4S ferredoxin iron-sulfur binding domain protein [Anaerocolumna sp.]
MIFYFTGTGNSLYTAKQLANQNESVINITDALKTEQFYYSLEEGESVGFIFPIYYWGLPTVMEEFLDKLKISNYKNPYTYAVCTCGQNIGDTMQILKKSLQSKNYHLDSGFSVPFLDNYILLYDIVSKEEQQKKLLEADKVLSHIKSVIHKKEKGVFDIEKGKLPGFFSYVVHQLYVHGRDTKKFYAMDTCIGCGKCEKICPVNSIQMVNQKPEWHGKCTQCLGCIHRCPVKAIQYGTKTQDRGRYTNPNVNL